MKTTKKYINTYRPTTAIHPSVFIVEWIEEKNSTVQEFAVHMECSTEVAQQLLDGKLSITEEWAKKIERLTNVPAGFWLRGQQHYDSFYTTKANKTTQ